MGKAAAVMMLVVALGLSQGDLAHSTPAFTSLGTDEVGDATSSMTDLREIGVRRTKAGISVRMWFEDLPEVAPAGPFALWHVRHSRKPRRECCSFRVNFGPQPELLFNRRDDDCWDCWEATQVKGRYQGDENTVIFFVPLDISPFEVGDTLTGCPVAEEPGMCGRGWSAATSPGSFGDDFMRTTRGFTIS